MRILIVGDFCPRGRNCVFIEEKQFNIILGEYRDLLNKSDYNIINLECPVVPENSNRKGIKKTGSLLKCTDKAIEFFKETGFNLVTLANNHFYDFGEQGVKDTLSICNQFNIDVVGGGKNIDEARRILYKKIKGKTIVFINLCETEFSIAIETHGGSNPLNPIVNYYQIQEAKENADYVIVIVCMVSMSIINFQVSE